MNLKNYLTLTISTLDFNLAAQNPDLMRQLRELTLNPRSGMNFELNRYEKIIKERPIKCQVLLAHRLSDLVAWALLTKEDSLFTFPNGYYDSDRGTMFQVYVHENHRMQGIATELFKKAKEMVGDEILCVCPHDYKSTNFYNRFERPLMVYL